MTRLDTVMYNFKDVLECPYRLVECDYKGKLKVTNILCSSKSRTFYKGGLQSCFSDSLYNQPNFSDKRDASPAPLPLDPPMLCKYSL